jgi:predicted nucleic acid-binding protein
MIIADSSSIILLAKASVLESLTGIDKLVIGRVVYEESVLQGKTKSIPDSLLIEKLVDEEKIIVLQAGEKTKAKLEKTLGLTGGENDTLALAIDNNARMVLTDDRKNIVACRITGMPFMISLDAIIELCQGGKISKEKAFFAFEKIKEHGWISEELIENRLKILKSKK